MRPIKYRKATGCFTSLALALASLIFPPGRAAAQQDAGGVTLRPGLIVHPSRDEAYVMTPEGVAAVDLKTGARRWTTREAAKPLALSGNLLVSQAEPKQAPDRLELVALNTQQGGAAVVRGSREMPQGVRATVGDSLRGRFEVEALPAADEVLVVWDYEPAMPRGRMDAREEARLMRESRLSDQPSNVGAFRMSLRTGATSQADPSAARVRTAATRASRTGPTRDAATGAEQYESADGLHLLTSERVADDPEWDKYRWTVTERVTGRRVGQFRTHLAFAPFVVRDSVLVYETTPFARRGVGEEPARLRGVNLANGQQVWAVEVRENVYRGPFPP